MGGGPTQGGGEDRGAGSLFTIKRESGEGGKVFGVQWERDVGIVSGGEDRRVQINSGVGAEGEGGGVVGVFGGVGE